MAATGCADDSVSGGGGTGGESAGEGGSAGGVEPSCIGTESDDPNFSLAMDVLRETLATHGIAGGAIAVVEEGKLVQVGVSGTKQAGVCDPVTPDTLFLLPYFSPILTSIAALDAVEEGKLSLEDPMTDVVPLIVERGAEFTNDITLHHLLTTSSMYTSASDAQPQNSTCTELAAAFADPVDPVIEAAPGTMMDWEDRQNSELAAFALETADNRPYEDVIAARVLEPLGMGGTFDLATAQAGDHSLGYQTSGADGSPYDCPNHYASYGYHGSISDYAKLATYLTGDGAPILEPETFEAMGSVQGPSWWSCDDATYITGSWRDPPIGERMQTRGGGALSGFNQSLFLFPDRGLAIVVMLNADIFAGDRVALDIAKIYGVDPTIEQWAAQQVDHDPATLQLLAGTYVDSIGFKGSGPRTLEVSWDPAEPDIIEGQVSAQGEEPQLLSFQDLVCPDNFATGIGLVVRFWRDDAGDPFGAQFAGYNGPPFFRVR